MPSLSMVDANKDSISEDHTSLRLLCVLTSLFAVQSTQIKDRVIFSSLLTGRNLQTNA